MLYSIIPPILVVLSLVGIIVFLVKKYPQISSARKNSKEEMSADDGTRKSDFSDQKNPEAGNLKWKNAQNIFLLSLEKLARFLKTVFLKLEVRFNNLITRIRNKRNGVSAAAESLKKEEDVLKKLYAYKSESKPEKNILPKQERIAVIEEEKVVRPMVSEKVASPKSKKEIKNKLEELLIERVAANPKDIEAYERLGAYYMEIENFIDAKECFKQVLKLNPTNRSVRYKIKRLESLLGA